MKDLEKRKRLKAYCLKTKCPECRIYNRGEGCLAVDFMSPEAVAEAYNIIMEENKMAKKTEEFETMPDMERVEEIEDTVEYSEDDLKKGWLLECVETDGEIMRQAFEEHDYGACFEAQRMMREAMYLLRDMDRDDMCAKTCAPPRCY